MSLTTAQTATLATELQNDPEQLGYAPYVASTDVDNLILMLTQIRDGVTPSPVNGVIGGPGGAVTGATNANPVVITSANHGLSTGDGVVIAGVLGNTAANGTFAVTKLTANTFSIPVTGNGAYTSGGVWTWCILNYANGNPVRNVSVPTQTLLGAIALSDVVTTLTAAQLTVIGGLLNDGAVTLTNADGTENNNAVNVKALVTNGTASAKAIKALENRLGSRVEQILNASGIMPTEQDLYNALGHT